MGLLSKALSKAREWGRDTEGRLRLDLAVTKAQLRDALRDQARERVEAMEALKVVVAERDQAREQLSVSLDAQRDLRLMLEESARSVQQAVEEDRKAVAKWIHGLKGLTVWGQDVAFTLEGRCNRFGRPPAPTGEGAGR